MFWKIEKKRWLIKTWSCFKIPFSVIIVNKVKFTKAILYWIEKVMQNIEGMFINRPPPWICNKLLGMDCFLVFVFFLVFFIVEFLNCQYSFQGFKTKLVNRDSSGKRTKKIGRVQVRNVTSPNRELKFNRKDNSHGSSSLGEGRRALRLNYV